MTRDELLAIAREPNVAAFLRVIRACEGTAADSGYRMLFGGELVDTFADHPRKLVRKSGYASTAAGAYQFLERTWDGLRTQYGLPDFTPSMQDAGAVALLIRRKALDAVRAGRLAEAVDLTNDEWASLPGSPYGQPTRTLDFVRKVFAMHGGQEQGAPAPIEQRTFPPAPPAEPVDTRPNDAARGLDLPPAAPQPATPPRKPMAPAIAVLTSLLPSIVELIPELGKLFGSGSAVADRNLRAAEKVAEVVVQATGAPNLQHAVETMQADPAARVAATRAVQAVWFELVESGGGGIEGARGFALKAIGGDDWRSIGYGLVLGLLALLIIAGGGALIWTLLRDPATTPEQRGMLIGAVVALMGSVVAFFFGSSVSSRAKDTALVQQLGQRQP